MNARSGDSSHRKKEKRKRREIGRERVSFFFDFKEREKGRKIGKV